MPAGKFIFLKSATGGFRFSGVVVQIVLDASGLQWRVHQSGSKTNPLPPRATIGKGRQRGVAGTANRIEVLSDQPFDVCPGFRDAAENLTAAGFRFDIANPYLKPAFSVLATPYEGGIHGDRDRRRRCLRPEA